MFTTYVLRSLASGRYYIGYTGNMSDRLRKHNSGQTTSTKPHVPWEVVYTESFQDKKSAWMRERQIKSYKGGEAFKNLLRVQ